MQAATGAHAALVMSTGNKGFFSCDVTHSQYNSHHSRGMSYKITKKSYGRNLGSETTVYEPGYPELHIYSARTFFHECQTTSLCRPD